MLDPVDRLRSALAGRYEIERPLGRGAMATVYLAHDLRHHRPVALKVLHASIAEVIGVGRFLREIQILAALTHPHILPLHDSGEADDVPYFVMPYIKEESLRDRLRRERQLPMRDALRIAREVADALSYAHAHGVVHRDIKPENVLLSGGHAVVADFGIAHALDAAGGTLSTTGVLLGTPLYMSPEQANAKTDLDGRTDIYSLGCVLYEMLAGEPPLNASSPRAALIRKLTEPPPPLRGTREIVPPALEAAVAKALARAPEERFRTADEFAQALRQARAELTSPPPSDATPPDRPAAEEATARLQRWRKGAGLGLGIALLTIGVMYAALSGTRQSRGGDAGHRAPAGPPDRASQVASIAVLPFVNLSGNPREQYLADGITDEIISALAKVEGLRVTSRTSAHELRDASSREVAAKLKVGSILQGSVNKLGERLRVSAQLINAADDSHLWADTYDWDMTGALDVQHTIAREVATRLAVSLADSSAPLSAKRAAPDPRAYDLYLRGRHEWNRRTVTGLRTAIGYFERALRLDSTYALAWSGLADCYVLLGSAEYPGLPPGEALPKAKAAAQIALALDDRVAAAHASLANVRTNYDWDWSAAEAEYRRAIELKPSYSVARQWYAYHLAAMGRLDEAIAAARRAHELDPLSVASWASLGRVSYFARQYDRAAELYRTAIELDSSYVVGHTGLGLALRQSGRYEEAIAALQRAQRLAGGQLSVAVSLLANTYAAAGRRDEALKLLDTLRRHATRGYVPPELMVVVYAGLGDKEEALDWLERAFGNRSGHLVYLKVEPLVDDLRAEPRFIAMLRQMRLN